MKIGIVIPTLHGGGAEFVGRSWITGLDKLGHQVVVYTYDARGDSQVVPQGVRRRHFPWRGRIRKGILLPLWLRRNVTRDELDVVICMMTFTNLIGIAALKSGSRVSMPLVISERNVPSVLTARFGLSGRIQLRLARWLYRRADAAVAISHPVAGDLVGGLSVSPSRIFVVPNPVISGNTRRSAPLPHHLTLGYVGRLVEQKRPELLFAVLGELAARGIQVEAVVIGDGPLRGAMEELAKAKEVPTRFLGWVEPWVAIASELDCLLLPSAVEGFGNVLVEAAAAGIPCVASSRALGVADALVPGLTGELSMDDSPARFADAILRAVDQSEPDALTRWLSRFSANYSVDLLMDVLQTVVSNSEKTPGAGAL